MWQSQAYAYKLVITCGKNPVRYYERNGIGMAHIWNIIWLSFLLDTLPLGTHFSYSLAFYPKQIM